MNRFLLKYFVLTITYFLLFVSAQASNVYISNIYINGNKHTKNTIILNEIPFSKGDIMSRKLLDKNIDDTKENLTNLSLFNYINISTEKDSLFIINKMVDSTLEYINVNISVEERWYYWPMLNIKLEERNLNSWIKKGEMNRITYDVGMRIYNMFGNNHKLTFSGSFGFEKGFNFSYSNIALNRQRTLLIGVSGYSLFNKTLNVKSEENKPVYIKYNDRFISKNYGMSFNFAYRSSIRQKHEVSVEFDRGSILDTVLQVNPAYWGIHGTVSHTFSVGYNYTIEGRDYNIYPTSGYYINCGLRLSDVNGFELVYSKFKLNCQYYAPLSERWYWGSKINLSANHKSKNAYIYDKALGYDNINMVGYDYYVADGQVFTIINNNIRYKIMSKKVVQLNFLSALSKFNKIHFTIYAKLNVDAGYVFNKHKNEGNRLENRPLYGSGLGIDVVTYYDTILSISYAINKFGEKGFFFGISTPLI